MKNVTLILVLAAVLLATVGTASAELTLHIDANHQGYIKNDTTAAVTFDGYDIRSATGKLDPVYVGVLVSGWRSFGDWVTEDMMEAFTALGSVTWGELCATTSIIADGNLSGETTLVAGGSLPIGIMAPLAVMADSHVAGSSQYGDLTFIYSHAATSVDPIDGHIEVVPEPVTLTLLGIGGLGVLIRRRKK